MSKFFLKFILLEIDKVSLKSRNVISKLCDIQIKWISDPALFLEFSIT
jgi:hypothetical protein